MKKTLLIIPALVMLAGCVPSRPKGIKDCDIRLADMREKETALTYVKFDMLLDAINPNGVDVVIDHMDFRMYAGGHMVGSGAASFRKVIPAGSSVKLKAPVSVDYFSAGMAVISMMKAGTVDYMLRAKVYYSTPYGDYKSGQSILQVHVP